MARAMCFDNEAASPDGADGEILAGWQHVLQLVRKPKQRLARKPRACSDGEPSLTTTWSLA